MNEQINAAIEKTRREMIESIKKHGLCNHNTISLSQELDKLIIQYQQIAING